MEQLPDTNPYRIHLARLLHTIENYVRMREEDIVLILIHLNTEERIIRFGEWAQTKFHDDDFDATAQEICRAAVWIHKGRTDLP